MATFWPLFGHFLAILSRGTSRDRGFCPGTFAPALVPGQRDTGTRKKFCPGTKGQRDVPVCPGTSLGTSRPVETLVHILRLRCANKIICFSQRVSHPQHSLVLSITLAESSQLMQDSSTCSTWFYSVRYNCVLCCEVSSIKTGGIKAQGPFSYRKVHNFNEKSPHN